MTGNDLVDAEDVLHLLQWAKGSRIKHLRVRIGDRYFDIRNEQLAAAPESVVVQPSAASLQVRSPSAGRFFKAVKRGAKLESQTVIGTIRLVRTSRPVLVGAAGRLASFTADDGTPVEYGEVVALVSPKDATC